MSPTKYFLSMAVCVGERRYVYTYVYTRTCTCEGLVEGNPRVESLLRVTCNHSTFVVLLWYSAIHSDFRRRTRIYSYVRFSRVCKCISIQERSRETHICYSYLIYRILNSEIVCGSTYTLSYFIFILSQINSESDYKISASQEMVSVCFNKIN